MSDDTEPVAGFLHPAERPPADNEQPPERHDQADGVHDAGEASAAATLRVVGTLARKALDQADGRPVDALLQISGLAAAWTREQDEPPEEWEPSEEHVALAATLVACHGGALVVGKHELVYLAADGMGYAKRLRVMPFGDGTVSIEVDDG